MSCFITDSNFALLPFRLLHGAALVTNSTAQQTKRSVLSTKTTKNSKYSLVLNLLLAGTISLVVCMGRVIFSSSKCETEQDFCTGFAFKLVLVNYCVVLLLNYLAINHLN